MYIQDYARDSLWIYNTTPANMWSYPAAKSDAKQNGFHVTGLNFIWTIM